MFNEGDTVQYTGLQFVVRAVSGSRLRIATFGNPYHPDGVELSIASRVCTLIQRAGKGKLPKLGLSTWETQNGDIIPIKDLEMSHLLNIVALLYRKGQEKNAQRHKLVTLEKEVIKRLGERVK